AVVLRDGHLDAGRDGNPRGVEAEVLGNHGYFGRSAWRTATVSTGAVGLFNLVSLDQLGRAPERRRGNAERDYEEQNSHGQVDARLAHPGSPSFLRATTAVPGGPPPWRQR